MIFGGAGEAKQMAKTGYKHEKQHQTLGYGTPIPMLKLQRLHIIFPICMTISHFFRPLKSWQ